MQADHARNQIKDTSLKRQRYIRTPNFGGAVRSTFVPDRHVFYGERLGWFDVADQLPRYQASSTGTEPDSYGPA